MSWGGGSPSPLYHRRSPSQPQKRHVLQLPVAAIEHDRVAFIISLRDGSGLPAAVAPEVRYSLQDPGTKRQMWPTEEVGGVIVWF
jgi:hypothetical protein